MEKKRTTPLNKRVPRHHRVVMVIGAQKGSVICVLLPCKVWLKWLGFLFFFFNWTGLDKKSKPKCFVSTPAAILVTGCCSKNAEGSRFFFPAGPLIVLTQVFTSSLSSFCFVKSLAMNFSSPHKHSGLRWLFNTTTVLCRLTGNEWRWPPSKLICRKNPALVALSSNVQKQIGGL